MNSEKKKIKELKEEIEKNLDIVLPGVRKKPGILHRAMRYSVLSGGKRLRPILMLLTADMVGVSGKRLMHTACGVELIHNFSLIHDDLPSMDDDDYRRGKLTCHKKFSESIAILAGDSLLALGFKCISESGKPELVARVADAIGSVGMAGGQVLDLDYRDKKINKREKRRIDSMKTAELFQVCFEAPVYFKKVSPRMSEALFRFGKNFGIAFQIRDDISDCEGNINILNKQLKNLLTQMSKDLQVFKPRGVLLDFLVRELYKKILV